MSTPSSHSAPVHAGSKILFYLPVVTPWWFEHIIAPLIRTLAGAHDVHVLAPAPWSGTGIGPGELQRCTDLTGIHWYIMDGSDHPTTRTVPTARADIVAFVRDLAPDYVLCRSADYETAQAFPGIVRMVMEGKIEPFNPPDDWAVLDLRPLDQGLMPVLDDAERARIEALIAPAWDRLRAQHAARSGERERTLSEIGVTGDGPVLLVPLEYEHEENFFAMYRVGGTPNARLVADLAAQVGSGVTLVLTNHPLNHIHVDNSALEAVVDALDNVVLAPPQIDGVSSTFALARVVDGMIQGDSKSFALTAFFGLPMLRRSVFESGAWLNAYSRVEDFLPAILAGTARRPAESDARLWFGYYMANNVFDPDAPDFDADAILARMDRAHDPARWEAGIARLRAALPRLFA
ncbi:hypothetical protein ACG3SL_07350 [Sphingomonas sp. CJ20]